MLNLLHDYLQDGYVNDARVKRGDDGHHTVTYSSFKLKLTPEQAKDDVG